MADYIACQTFSNLHGFFFHQKKFEIK